jgi:hypothetical protein
LTYFQAIKGGDQKFLTKGGKQSNTEGRFKMEKRFKPSIQEKTKTEIMISLPRKEALDEKEQGTFLLIKILRILDSCKAWPTSRPRTEYIYLS